MACLCGGKRYTCHFSPPDWVDPVILLTQERSVQSHEPEVLVWALMLLG